jgi:hypothetical protein
MLIRKCLLLSQWLIPKSCDELHKKLSRATWSAGRTLQTPHLKSCGLKQIYFLCLVCSLIYFPTLHRLAKYSSWYYVRRTHIKRVQVGDMEINAVYMIRVISFNRVYFYVTFRNMFFSAVCC